MFDINCEYCGGVHTVSDYPTGTRHGFDIYHVDCDVKGIGYGVSAYSSARVKPVELPADPADRH